MNAIFNGWLSLRQASSPSKHHLPIAPRMPAWLVHAVPVSVLVRFSDSILPASQISLPSPSAVTSLVPSQGLVQLPRSPASATHQPLSPHKRSSLPALLVARIPGACLRAHWQHAINADAAASVVCWSVFAWQRSTANTRKHKNFSRRLRVSPPGQTRPCTTPGQALAE